MNTKLANGVYLGVAILTAALIYCSAPTEDYKPYGIILLAKPDLALANKSQVQVYDQPEPGAAYQTLASVHVQYHFDKPTEQVALRAIQYAQSLAGSVGAHGLWLQQLGEDPTNKVLILNAKAMV